MNELTDHQERRNTFHSSRKAPPVGEHHERQALSVQILNSLGCFESRIWEPHLSCLLDDLKIQIQKHTSTCWLLFHVINIQVLGDAWVTPYLGLWVQVSWISWDRQLHWPSFHCNHSGRYPTQSVEIYHSAQTTTKYYELNFIKQYSIAWIDLFVEVCIVAHTWLCLPPHSEPMAASSPWRIRGQRNHSARNPLELYVQRGHSTKIVNATE